LSPHGNKEEEVDAGVVLSILKNSNPPEVTKKQ
jgi:hypothetical protein